MTREKNKQLNTCFVFSNPNFRIFFSIQGWTESENSVLRKTESPVWCTQRLLQESTGQTQGQGYRSLPVSQLITIINYHKKEVTVCLGRHACCMAPQALVWTHTKPLAPNSFIKPCHRSYGQPLPVPRCPFCSPASQPFVPTSVPAAQCSLSFWRSAM